MEQMSVALNIKVSRELKDRLTAQAQREDRSLSRVVRRALRMYLDSHADPQNEQAKSQVGMLVLPEAKGGTDEPDNLQLLCRSCNSAKHDRLEVANG